MEEKFEQIKTWLSSDSINFFGLPLSGKDTVGLKLAEVIGAEFLSSGDIIRQAEAEKGENTTAEGKLTPTNKFYDLVLPYFEREELTGRGLVLSSIGRWSGEETRVMEAAASGGHPIKAAVFLDMSIEELKKRWEANKTLVDRGERADDKNWQIMETRIREFEEKTKPVLGVYEKMGKLIKVKVDGSREEMFERVIEGILRFKE